jgi:lipid II:glycine glycyltransferase (peptidoglycan interpeptide bridge formation enzyme)
MQLRVDAMDASEWDAFVSGAPEGHFMQSHAWGEVQRHEGWTPHYLSLADGTSVVASALLLSRAIPLTGRRMFYAPRGPVVPGGARNLHAHLASGIRTFVHRNRGAFLRVDPYEVESPAIDGSLAGAGYRKVARDWSYWNAPKFVFWLDLQRSEDALLKGMSSGCQKDIRAGYKKGVSYTLGTAGDLPEFHRLLTSMSTNKGIAAHDEAYYSRLYEVLNRSCELRLFLARFEDKVISVGMSVRYGRKAWLLYAASDRDHFKLRINRNVQWEMIRWAHAAGCLRYDFRGTATGDPPSPADPGYGVYEFKKSFGPQFVRLAGYYDLVARRPTYGLFRFGEERALPIAYRAKVWLDERHAKA